MSAVPHSTLHLPAGTWPSLLDCLCERFPAVGREAWLRRFAAGKVTDEQDRPLTPESAPREGMRVRYYRELEVETPIPFEHRVLYQDEHLVVVDKPHFLPVMPAGRFVEQTLLVRLRRALDNPQLVPLHRLDRLTAGLVMFSACAATRDAYLELFRQRRIAKCYEAVAAALPGLDFPRVQASRLERGEPFFRMREVAGEANAQTRMEVLERGAEHWRYALQPVTGRKHQLRVQMAALGAPILGDPLYPVLQAEMAAEDFSTPLSLLARALRFDDPLDGRPRHFESRLQLSM